MIVKVTTKATTISQEGVLYTFGAVMNVTPEEYNNIKELVSIEADADDLLDTEDDVKIEKVEEIDEEPTPYEELRAKAKAEGVKGYHKMSADELREVLGVE